MPTASLQAMVHYCDRILRTAQTGDYDRAANGLQVENRGKVRLIAAAVDATLATVRLAIESEADLLIAHHGLFWSPAHPWTGKRYELLRLLLKHDLAVYSSHLPLDAHPRLGNNVQFCRALRLKNLKPFFSSHGQTIGIRARSRIGRGELAERVRKVTGVEPKLIPGGSESCHSIGIVTGGAGGELQQAAAEGIDTFVTGEGPHWTYGLAEELGINVFYAGHYATETFGVKALAAELSRRFEIPWLFIDHPTGL